MNVNYPGVGGVFSPVFPFPQAPVERAARLPHGLLPLVPLFDVGLYAASLYAHVGKAADNGLPDVGRACGKLRAEYVAERPRVPAERAARLVAHDLISSKSLSLSADEPNSSMSKSRRTPILSRRPPCTRPYSARNSSRR